MGFRKSTCGIFPRGNNRYIISAGLGVLSSANHYAYMPRTLVLDFPDCTELGPDHKRAASATLAMLMIPQANLQGQICCGSICCHNPNTCNCFKLKQISLTLTLSSCQAWPSTSEQHPSQSPSQASYSSCWTAQS